MPFFLYSELRDIAAPILDGIICYMAEGRPPPKYFNMVTVPVSKRQHHTHIAHAPNHHGQL